MTFKLIGVYFSTPEMDHHIANDRIESKAKELTHGKTILTNTEAAKTKQLVGCLLVFAGAVCFYFSSAAVRWSKQHVSLATAFFVFSRFFLGFAVVSLSLIVKKHPLAARKYSLLVGRALANTVAVYCFYTAVNFTSVAQANILNMTYCIFVALFTWLTLKNQRNLFMTIALLVAFVGIFLVLARGPLVVGWLHLWGLASGICGAIAIITLNASRRWHDTETILFYLFGIGTLLVWLIFPKAIHWPSYQQAYYLFLCSSLSIAGQYLITYGHKFVTAVEGSIIASMRIPLAAFLGPLVVADPALTLKGWAGTGLIFAANVVLASQKMRNNK